MASRRKAQPVSLTAAQRERLERLWFTYGNYGPKTTPGNHQFIQSLLEHGLDLRPLQTKRTAKRDRPTDECVAAVEAVLSSEGGDGEGAARLAILRLILSFDGGRKTETPGPGLKRMLEDMRRHLPDTLVREGADTDGEDAA